MPGFRASTTISANWVSARNSRGLGLHDLVHSGPNGGGLLFGTDASGNLLWYINLGGWNGYVPGRQSPTDPSGFNATPRTARCR